MLNLDKKNFFRITFLVSLFALIFAYFVEYVLGYQPCNLCLIERIPYIASVILISLLFILNRFKKIIAIILFLFFIFGAIISFYHVGIEQGFFSESFVCNLSDSQDSLTTKQLLKQLENTPVSCKDVTFRFIGLSLATINTIISVFLSGIMFKVVRNYGQNK